MSFAPIVHLFGDDSPPEFGPALDCLRKHAITHHCAADSLTVHRDSTAGGSLSQPLLSSPDVILLLQNRPGQWSAEMVERLHARWPLARLVALLGSWCEGEPRTGRPLPGVARVLWHQWEAVFGRYWESAGDAPHPWRLPRTQAATEPFLADVIEPARGSRLSSPRPLVAIEAVETAGFEALADACRAAGYAVARWRADAPREVQGAAVLVWDEPGWSHEDLDRLQSCVLGAAEVPVIAILGMLRWEDWVRARGLGAAVVLAKPFVLADFCWHLDRQIAACSLQGCERILRVPGSEP